MTNFYNKINNVFNLLRNYDLKFNIFRSVFGQEFDFFDFVFLCGGNSDKYTSRDSIQSILGKDYSILLAEHFIECRSNLDLLSFERIFEAISSSVVICTESAGSFCELGAFTQLSDENSTTTKEIIIFDASKENDPSFINQGPVSIVKGIDKRRVIYANFLENRDGKSGFLLSEEVFKANHFSSLNKISKLHSYFKKPIVKNEFFIKDLTTFLAVLLDLTCYIGYINSKIALDFIRTVYDVKKIYLDCEGFVRSSEKVSAVCETFFMILVKMEILKISKVKNDKLYIINDEKINDSVKSKWFGSILFNNSFLHDKTFLARKADFKGALKLL